MIDPLGGRGPIASQPYERILKSHREHVDAQSMGVVVAVPATASLHAVLARVEWQLYLVAVATLPLMGIIVTSVPTDRPWWVGVFYTDIIMWPMLAIWFVRRIGPLTRRPVDQLVMVTASLIAALGVAFLAHPSTNGVLLLLRVAGSAAAADITIRAVREGRARRMVDVLAISMGFELALAVAQWHLRRPVGFGMEYSTAAWQIAGAIAPAGTTPHPYMYTALAFVLTGLTLGLALTGHMRFAGARLALAVAPAAMTYSRTSVLGVVALTVLLGLAVFKHRDRRTPATLLLALLVTVGSVGLVFHAGWVGRAGQTTSVTTGSGRVQTIRQGLAMVEASPIVGVGPGNFVETAYRNPKVRALSSEKLTVHNVALALITESGLIGAVALAALALVLLRRTRRSLASLCVLAAVAPFASLDQTHWVHTPNMVALGLALGMAVAVAPVMMGTATTSAASMGAGRRSGAKLTG